MKPQTRSEIVDLLERHGLTPIHHLGQNFLADSNITRKIVEVAGIQAGDQVLEVGAGTGTLTRALAATGSHVVAYEIDSRLAPVLEEVTAGLDVELRFADVMNVDLGVALGPGHWVMVANLPYNVGTPLVLDALRNVPDITRFVVMVQREVAERFAASPGSKEYGLPSVISGIYAPARVAFRVPPQVFYPSPSVDSAVVLMERVTAPRGADRAVELAAAGFNQRRKMLRRSLTGMFEDPTMSIRAAGLDPTFRAEDLAPADYLRLAQV